MFANQELHAAAPDANRLACQSLLAEPFVVEQFGAARDFVRGGFVLNQPMPATETTGWFGGFDPSEPKNGRSEKLKMPPSSPTIR
jgi:hypothetical protein